MHRHSVWIASGQVFQLRCGSTLRVEIWAFWSSPEKSEQFCEATAIQTLAIEITASGKKAQRRDRGASRDRGGNPSRGPGTAFGARFRQMYGGRVCWRAWRLKRILGSTSLSGINEADHAANLRQRTGAVSPGAESIPAQFPPNDGKIRSGPPKDPCRLGMP